MIIVGKSNPLARIIRRTNLPRNKVAHNIHYIQGGGRVELWTCSYEPNCAAESVGHKLPHLIDSPQVQKKLRYCVEDLSLSYNITVCGGFF